MVRRISPIAKPGSLLKTLREAKRPRRPKRDTEPAYLALIRQLPCLSCDADPAGEAAHLRKGVGAGMGLKSGDGWALPLCHGCHMEQHEAGELTFWLRLGLDPIRIAIALQTAFPNLDAMRGIVHMHREQRK